MLDIAGLKRVRTVSEHYAITSADIDEAIAAQNVELRSCDVVLIRTGTLSSWGVDGAGNEIIKKRDH